MKKYLRNGALLLSCIFLFSACSSFPPPEPLPEGPKGEAVLVLIKAMNDEHPSVRAAAVVSLGKIKSRYPEPELVALLWREKSKRVKLAVIEVLGRMGGTKSDESLSKFYEERQIEDHDLLEKVREACIKINRREESKAGGKKK
jgi:HEAT repeat protein